MILNQLVTKFCMELRILILFMIRSIKIVNTLFKYLKFYWGLFTVGLIKLYSNIRISIIMSIE